jgi:hypothetical protein
MLTMDDEIWNKRREHLQDAVKKAVLELLEHTSALSFALPIEGGRRRIEVKITTVSAGEKHGEG